jgi:hypothetical protein
VYDFSAKIQERSLNLSYTRGRWIQDYFIVGKAAASREAGCLEHPAFCRYALCHDWKLIETRRRPRAFSGAQDQEAAIVLGVSLTTESPSKPCRTPL